MPLLCVLLLPWAWLGVGAVKGRRSQARGDAAGAQREHVRGGHRLQVLALMLAALLVLLLPSQQALHSLEVAAGAVPLTAMRRGRCLSTDRASQP